MKYRFSVILLVLALITYAYASFSYYRYNWYPVSIPISSLESPVIADFMADVTGRYRAYIQFENKNNDLYWKCVFGTANYDSNCSQIADSVSVQWKLISQASFLDQGTAAGPDRKAWGGGGGDTPEGSIVSFIPAESGTSYRIEVSVKGPSSTIKVTKPYLKVNAPQGQHKDAYITRTLISNVALLILLIAMLAAIIEYYFKQKKLRHSKTTTSE